jgi:nucleoside-diphosphate-sugar epimerase
MSKDDGRSALVVGVTGMMGLNIAEHLVGQGWKVHGLSRHTSYTIPGVNHINADILNPAQLSKAVEGLDFDTIFYCTWKKHDTEAENCKVNGQMIQNTMDAVRPNKFNHVVLITGLKHYLGPFEAYAATPMDTPFHESQERLNIENFYYTQEDILFEEAKKQGFTWSVLRPHSMIGYALGNVMNMGVTLAIYASICKETGAKFIFPGSREQYNGVVDVTDGVFLAKHAYWAATSPNAKNQAFNSCNGDVMRWRQTWKVIADYFGLEDPGYPAEYSPLQPRMDHADSVWEGIVKKHSLKPYKASELASWWHTDGDLGRQVETFADMGKSRNAGFNEVKVSFDSFTDLFKRLRTEKIIP